MLSFFHQFTTLPDRESYVAYLSHFCNSVGNIIIVHTYQRNLVYSPSRSSTHSLQNSFTRCNFKQRATKCDLFVQAKLAKGYSLLPFVNKLVQSIQICVHMIFLNLLPRRELFTFFVIS